MSTSSALSLSLSPAPAPASAMDQVVINIFDAYNNRCHSMVEIYNAMKYDVPTQDCHEIIESILDKIKLSTGILDITIETSNIINIAHQYAIDEMKWYVEINEYYATLSGMVSLIFNDIVNMLHNEDKIYPNVTEIKYNDFFITFINTDECIDEFVNRFPSLAA